jgi:ferritin-like metal-binding protein YciE
VENSSLLELMIDQLRDVYDAEKQLTKALPRMAKAASDEELAEGFREHTGQTQEQAQRIEQIFEKLGQKARSKPCAAMKGLIEEGREVIEKEMEESMTDIALCAAARRVEHYEIAAYDSLMTAAKMAKQPEVAELLKQTLGEETEMDKRLSNLGKRLLKEAMTSAKSSGMEEEEEGSGRGQTARSSGAQSRSGPSKGAQARGGQNASAQKRAGSQAKAKSSGSRKQSGGSRGRDSGGHLSQTTTDPEEIRLWAEERGGKPACVQGTGGKGDIGLLRIEFPGKPNANDAKLTPISWEDFFDKFEERGLAMVYQEETAGGQKSNFNKLIAREGGAKPKARTAR